MAAARHLEVDPERITRWVTGFADRHGAPTWTHDQGAVVLTAPDGAVARLGSWAGPDAARGVTSVQGLVTWARPPQVIGLVLVRRGGYAVGLGRADRLEAHKCGTRYVQSRTAAGGWSQQRFARRRGNQADALVGAVAEHSMRIVVPGRPTALVVGGDRALVAGVLADARLSGAAMLPRRQLFDVPDPRLTVLQQALRRGRAVRILLTEPP